MTKGHTFWQATDGERLRSLRDAAGFDIQQFAKSNCISIAQLKLLEDGVSSSLFHSPAIMTAMGRKLLQRLGREDGSGAPEQATAVQAYVPTDQPQVRVNSDQSWKPEALRNLSRLAAESARDLQVLPAERLLAETAAPTGKNYYVLGLLAATALLAIGQANLQYYLQWLAPTLYFSSEDALVQAVSAQSETPQSVTVPKVDRANDESRIDPLVGIPVQTSIAPVAKPILGAAPLTTQADRALCPWSDKEIQLQPLQVRTDGNYVHFMASDDVKICVLDGQMKTSVLSLKAGDAKSVRGAAPWHIYSRNMSGMKVFFQGYHVPVLDSKITQIGLKER
ncbi:MAG: hypothetical protein QE283_07465 [Rhodoferax sp.]|nr:hypothetical protein [Rhodoferax sp.]